MMILCALQEHFQPRKIVKIINCFPVQGFSLPPSAAFNDSNRIWGLSLVEILIAQTQSLCEARDGVLADFGCIWQNFNIIQLYKFISVTDLFIFFVFAGTPHTAWKCPCLSQWRRMTQTSATTPKWGFLRRQNWAKAKTSPALALRIIYSQEWSLRLYGIR